MTRNGVWGIIGGLGPLASAAFLQTIYEQSAAGPEQGAPSVILLSDPGFPDRTGCLFTHQRHILLERLNRHLETLQSLNSCAMVICCVTLHAVLDEVPERLRAGVVSLIDVMLTAVAAGDERHLLLCTSGSRLAGLFERHPRWPAVRDRIVLPDDEDQAAIHAAIYEVKQNRTNDGQRDLVELTMRKYHVASFIAGCTEMHILHRRWRQRTGRPVRCVDPLQILAERIARADDMHATASAATS